MLDYKNIKFNDKITLNINDKILFYLPRKNQCNSNFVNNILKFKLDFIEQDLCNFNNIKSFRPYNFDNWKKHILNYKFTIGSRIHGCILSLKCNIPSFLICIDSRTLELAQILNIPHYNNCDNKLEFKNNIDFLEFINKNYVVDINKFRENTKQLQENFKKLIS